MSHPSSRMFSAYLANLLVWVLGSVNTLDLPIVFSEALSCVMCTHMLLNVQAPREHEVEIHDLGSQHAAPRTSFVLRETSHGQTGTPVPTPFDLAVPHFVRMGPPSDAENDDDMKRDMFH
jgi:hypothetical protein